MTHDTYIASRQVFSLKTDMPIHRLRHEIIVRGNLVYRYSALHLMDFHMTMEAQIIDKVLEAVVPAIPVAVDTDAMGTFQFMRKARGEAVAELAAENRRSIWPQLALALKRLHSIRGQGAGLIVDSDNLRGYHESWGEYLYSYLDDHLDHAVEYGLIDEKTEDLICRYMGAVVQWQGNSLLHGDLSDYNVFQRDGHLTDIIDWEDALIGDTTFDLANWACFTSRAEEDYSIMARAYYGEALPEDFWRKFWTYFLRIALSRLVYLHRANFQDLTAGKNRIENALAHLKTLS